MTTFTRYSPGAFDAATNTWATPATTTWGGSAIQVRSDPERLKALSLELATSITLLFTPTDYELRAFTTDFVQPGDTVSWNSQTYTVKDVDPIAPDGIVIAARVVVGA